MASEHTSHTYVNKHTNHVYWCRYCPDKNAATSVNGTTGCSIYFLGRLYDGVTSKRRGVTSLSLPKPKLHLTLNQPVSL